jgi:hypothetical protein
MKRRIASNLSIVAFLAMTITGLSADYCQYGRAVHVDRRQGCANDTDSACAHRPLRRANSGGEILLPRGAN